MRRCRKTFVYTVLTGSLILTMEFQYRSENAALGQEPGRQQTPSLHLRGTASTSPPSTTHRNNTHLLPHSRISSNTEQQMCCKKQCKTSAAPAGLFGVNSGDTPCSGSEKGKWVPVAALTPPKRGSKMERKMAAFMASDSIFFAVRGAPLLLLTALTCACVFGCITQFDFGSAHTPILFTVVIRTEDLVARREWARVAPGGNLTNQSIVNFTVFNEQMSIVCSTAPRSSLLGTPSCGVFITHLKRLFLLSREAMWRHPPQR